MYTIYAAGGGGLCSGMSVEVIDTLQLSLVQQLHRKSRNKISLTLLLTRDRFTTTVAGLALNIA